MSVITEGTPIRLDCAFVNGQNVFCVVTRLDDGSLRESSLEVGRFDMLTTYLFCSRDVYGPD